MVSIGRKCGTSVFLSVKFFTFWVVNMGFFFLNICFCLHELEVIELDERIEDAFFS